MTTDHQHDPATLSIACGPDGCTVSMRHPLPAPPDSAEKLRRRRVRLALSQRDVERQCGVDARRLNEFEHGRGWPSPYEWGRLTAFYRELEAKRPEA